MAFVAGLAAGLLEGGFEELPEFLQKNKAKCRKNTSSC
jgi:hypothetical protein